MPIERLPSRRQSAALLMATGAVAAIALLATSSGGAAAKTAARSSTAEARDLTVTDDDRGTLARSDTTTVLYDGTGGRVNGGPAGSELTAQSADPATVAQIQADATTTTTEPPSTTTTEPAATTTTEPTATTTGSPIQLDPPVDDGTDQQPMDEQPTDQSQLPTSDGVIPDQGDQGGDLPAASGRSTATLTELLAVGETATRGVVLYRADDEPIVALLSTTPLFRDLRAGIDDGPDVQAIESELRALGYSGFTVDEHFDTATAAAVKDWEDDLGRATPDGVVTVGEIRLLDGPTSVLEHAAAVGDLLEPDDAVLVLGAESRVIEADVEASEAKDWAVGTSLTIEWADGTTSTGSVVEIGRDVTDSQVPTVVALEDGSGTEAPIGSRVDLIRTVTERPGAVAVPVSAIVAGTNGPAVRLTGDADRLVDVELGIVDDGWVEILDGLDVGTEVRLPA